MPAKLDRCVQHLLKDPNFKPQTKGQSKESAAWAVCQSALNKAMEDIEEALIILKKFEDDDEQSSLFDDDSTEGGTT